MLSTRPFAKCEREAGFRSHPRWSDEDRAVTLSELADDRSLALKRWLAEGDRVGELRAVAMFVLDHATPQGYQTDRQAWAGRLRMSPEVDAFARRSRTRGRRRADGSGFSGSPRPRHTASRRRPGSQTSRAMVDVRCNLPSTRAGGRRPSSGSVRSRTRHRHALAPARALRSRERVWEIEPGGRHYAGVLSGSTGSGLLGRLTAWRSWRVGSTVISRTGFPISAMATR